MSQEDYTEKKLLFVTLQTIQFHIPERVEKKIELDQQKVILGF